MSFSGFFSAFFSLNPDILDGVLRVELPHLPDFAIYVSQQNLVPKALRAIKIRRGLLRLLILSSIGQPLQSARRAIPIRNKLMGSAGASHPKRHDRAPIEMDNYTTASG